MSPSAAGSELESDPLGLGGTLEYVSVSFLCMIDGMTFMTRQFAQHGFGDQSVLSLKRVVED